MQHTSDKRYTIFCMSKGFVAALDNETSKLNFGAPMMNHGKIENVYDFVCLPQESFFSTPAEGNQTI